MNESVNNDGTGWARFSDCMTLRYRLARSCFGAQGGEPPPWDVSPTFSRNRVVFIMLNPSTADAFILDPTVRRCMKFAQADKADVLEVVNIFPLRSTDPAALYTWTRSLPGPAWEAINAANNAQIVAAAAGARLVIAAWGRHGAHLMQGTTVRELCHKHDIKLYHLGLNKDGSPKHPLYIKGGTEPKEWTL